VRASPSAGPEAARAASSALPQSTNGPALSFPVEVPVHASGLARAPQSQLTWQVEGFALVISR
jgi:hypothetical protein